MIVGVCFFVGVDSFEVVDGVLDLFGFGCVGSGFAGEIGYHFFSLFDDLALPGKGFLQLLQPFAELCDFLTGGGCFFLEWAGFFCGFLFALIHVDGPGEFAIGTFRQEAKELFEGFDGQGCFFADFDAAQVVVPDFSGGLTFGEEEVVGFDACSGGCENSAGKADD